MKRFMVAMLLLGATLLGVVLYQTDLSEVSERLRQVGAGTLALIFAVFLSGHLLLAASWLLTLPQAPRTPYWLYRIWRVLMVGAALESVMPLGGLGGDPVKAALLKRHYGIRYTDGSTSLVLTRMSDLLAQVVFVAIGLVLMFRAELLPPGYRVGAGAGLLCFAAAILLFLLAQTKRGFSKLRGWLERGPLGRRLSGRAVRVLDAIHEVEDQLVAFYASQRTRFTLSVLCAFGEWTANAVAVYIAVNALGHGIGFGDALVIEAFVALIRSMLFFVPADLGTQEAAQVLICGAITGSPETGLALAAIRRSRDLLWIFGGLAIGGVYSLRQVKDLTRPEPVVEVAPAAGAYADASATPVDERFSRRLR